MTFWWIAKISGILIETSLDKNSIRSAIIGIGLNVNKPYLTLPSMAIPPRSH
ncbi:MAG: hypothetical protein IPP17_19375 [Bacteroidetes bacterium]|nr:hypothetical protein [Bacteroidota bacterium]